MGFVYIAIINSFVLKPCFTCCVTMVINENFTEKIFYYRLPHYRFSMKIEILIQTITIRFIL